MMDNIQILYIVIKLSIMTYNYIIKSWCIEATTNLKNRKLSKTITKEREEKNRGTRK